MKTSILCAFGVLAMAGCGGSGGTQTFDSLTSEALALESRATTLLNDEGFSPFTDVEMNAGSATYTGHAVYTEGTTSGMVDTADYAAVGVFSATAEFGMVRNVTGTINGFYEVSNPEVFSDGGAGLAGARSAGAIEGSLGLAMEIREFAGDAFATGDMSGQLTKAAGNGVLFSDFPIGGDFIGDGLDIMKLTGRETGTGTFNAFSVTAEQ